MQDSCLCCSRQTKSANDEYVLVIFTMPKYCKDNKKERETTTTTPLTTTAIANRQR